jgi:hypothetical protein
MRQLAEELVERFDTKWDSAKISRIESGERTLMVAEWLQVAAVLNVAPGALLTSAEAANVKLGPDEPPINPGKLLNWIDGRSALSSSKERPFGEFSTPRWQSWWDTQRDLDPNPDSYDQHVISSWLSSLEEMVDLPAMFTAAMRAIVAGKPEAGALRKEAAKLFNSITDDLNELSVTMWEDPNEQHGELIGSSSPKTEDKPEGDDAQRSVARLREAVKQINEQINEQIAGASSPKTEDTRARDNV